MTDESLKLPIGILQTMLAKGTEERDHHSGVALRLILFNVDLAGLKRGRTQDCL